MKKGLSKIFFANVVNLILSFALGFVLPKKLSIDNYAIIKTFQFYVGYVGFLHLGYADGMYLDYGGREIRALDRQQLSNNLSTMRYFQLIVSVSGIVLALTLRSTVLVLVALSILPLNMTAYYKYLYQATGEFKKYSNIMNMTSLFTSIIVLSFIYIFGFDSGMIYASAYFAIYFIVYLLLEFSVKVRIIKDLKSKFSMHELHVSVKQGFILMLGNFSSGLLSGMDRWFVKALLPLKEFAFYSFAVSVEILITTFMNPLIVTFYNYICVEKDVNKIRKIKTWCTIIGMYLITFGFGVKWIIEYYLQQYTNSVKVLFLLFATQIFYMIIKVIYINYYKALKLQKKYLIQLIEILIIGCLLNVIFWNIWRCKEAFAAGTLITAAIWLVMCAETVPELKGTIKETGIVLSSIICYLLCGYFLSPITGGIFYVIYISAIILIFIPENMKELKALILLQILGKREK